MKLSCPVSGTTYHTSTGYGSGSSPHPIFSLRPVQLLKLLEQSTSDNRNHDDTYLLGVALLASLPSRFDTPVEKQAAYPHILHNWDSLVRVAYKVDSRYLGRYPTLVVDKHTASLSNLGDWLETYESIFRELATSQHLLSNGQRLARKEAVVESLLLSPLKRNKNKVASLVSEWADVAGKFPAFKTTLDDGSEVILSSYWKHLIILAVKGDHASMMNSQGTLRDLKELIQHCEDEIPHGTVTATSLMTALRDALGVLSEFDPSTETVRVVKTKVDKADRFQVLFEDDIDSGMMEQRSGSTTQPEINSLIDPETSSSLSPNAVAPVSADFPSAREYLKAMLAYKRGVSSNGL